MRTTVRFASLSLAVILSTCLSRAQTVVYVDAGNSEAPASWNNIALNTLNSTLLLRGTNAVYAGIRLQVKQALTLNPTAGITNNLLNDAASFRPSGASVCYGQNAGPSTGEMVLDGLSTNVAYTFTFFGSRAGTPSPSDVRQALYTVAGATTVTAVLDALGNTSQVATVSGVLPRADGTMTLSVSKGPANNNSNGFFYLQAFRITFSPPATPDVAPLQTPVYFDMLNNESRQAGWNNVNGNTTAETNAVYDASNRLTSVTFRMTYTPQGTNTFSLPALAGDALQFAPAGGSVLYGGTARTRISAQLMGLATNTAYTLTFFGCRNGVSDNRDTFFTVTGSTTKSRTLNASSNASRVATVSAVVPNPNGTLDIAVNAGPDNTEASNRFFYLNAFKLEAVPLPSSDANVVFLDANGDNASAAAGWNNCSFNALNTYALIQTNSAPSGIRLRILTASDGSNGNGTLTPSGPAAEFAPVRANNAVGHTNLWVVTASTTNPPLPTLAARFSNLSTNIPYCFTFYAFREDASNVRETRCRYIGATTNYSLMNVSVSSNRVAVTDGVYPAADGTITLDLTTGPNQTEATGFFYIGGLKITYPDGGAPFDPANGIAPGKRLLFFGNSFTINNNVPGAVGQLAAAAGYPAPFVVSASTAGEDLAFHLQQVATNASANVSHPDLGMATWNHVILQGFSTEATALLGDPSAFRSNAVALFQRVAHHASGNGSGASAILFQTWARAPENTEFYPPYFPGAAAMQSEVNANYAAACEDLRAAEGPYAARVAPVGEAFAGEAFADDLYAADNYHASLLGSRLAALVLFRTIYGDTVSDIPYAAVSNTAAAGLTASDWTRLAARADSVAISGTPSSYESKLIERFYVDAANNNAGARWNNVDTSSPRAASLITTDGRQPGALLSVRRSLQGLNSNGTPTPTGAAAEFAPAGINSNFGNLTVFQNKIIPQGQLVLHGLSTNRLYAFTFYASRMSAVSNRQTRYTAEASTTESVLLEPVNNASQTASTGYLVPTADGTITVTVEPGPDNADATGFYHLGALRIDSKWHAPLGGLLLLR